MTEKRGRGTMMMNVAFECLCQAEGEEDLQNCNLLTRTDWKLFTFFHKDTFMRKINKQTVNI